MKDPPVRSDGLCARPGCERLRRQPAQTAFTRAVGLGQYEADPFCCTECCRIYHGVKEPGATRIGYAGKAGAPKVYA